MCYLRKQSSRASQDARLFFCSEVCQSVGAPALTRSMRVRIPPLELTLAAMIRGLSTVGSPALNRLMQVRFLPSELFSPVGNWQTILFQKEACCGFDSHSGY